MPAFEIQDREPQPALAIRLRSTIERIPALLTVALAEVWEAAEAAGLAPDGPPYTRYLSPFDAPGGQIEYEAGAPLLAPAPAGSGRAVPVELSGGTVAVAWHVGPYARSARRMTPSCAGSASRAARSRGRCGRSTGPTRTRSPTPPAGAPR